MTNKIFSKSLFTILLLLLVGNAAAWGQVADGYYYLANNNSSEYKGYNNAQNFYLCPAQYWYNYSGSTANFTEDNGMPFLTTYKTNRDKASIWMIKKVADKACFMMIHEETGKYLTINNSLSGYKDHRMRVHLETQDTPTDRCYFTFENLGLAIDGIDGFTIGTFNEAYGSGNKNANRYLNPASGNKNYYTPTANETPNTGGIIGFYTKGASNNTGSNWYLEEVLPEYEIIGDQVYLSYIKDGIADIYYTTDGTTPSPSNGTKYQAPFTLTTTTLKAMAVLKENGHETAVASFTLPVLPGSSHTYLLQNQDNTNFYMIPGDLEGTNRRVNTTSLWRPSMEWYFVGAGRIDGVQYYNIVNKESEARIYRTGTNIWLHESGDFSADDYMFSLNDLDDYFMIQAKGGNFLLKSGGNLTTSNNEAGILTNSGTNDNRSHWRILPSSEKPTFSPPFTLSNDASTALYRIRNVGDDNYYMTPSVGHDYAGGNDAYAGVSTTVDDKTAWYFKPAKSDEWLTYYHIVNAYTGEYLYFRGNEITDNQTQAFETLFPSQGEEDRFLFALANTTTDGQYYIVPYLLRYLTDNSYMLVWRDGSAPLKTTKNRNGTNYKWTFEPCDLYVMPPTFEQNPTTGAITITSFNNAVDYYYTLDGTDPTTANTKYTEPLNLTIGVTDLKAIAVAKNNSSIVSTVATFDMQQMASPTITFDYETGRVSISHTVEGTTFYYTTNGGEPTTSSTLYDGAFSLSEAATIKAIAEKGGYLRSETAELAVTKVATPTITLDAGQRVVIKTDTEGALIYYTTDGTEPTNSSTPYTGPLTSHVSGKLIKAIAVKVNMLKSEVTSKQLETFTCALPDIYRVTSNTFAIRSTFPTDGYHIYYTTDGSEPTTSSEEFAGDPVPFDNAAGITVKAIVTAEGYNTSAIGEKTFGSSLDGDGSAGEPYLIFSSSDFDLLVESINADDTSGKHYLLQADISYSGSSSGKAFQGIFDGDMHTISGLSQPLFAEVNDGVVKNVMLKDVVISTGENVGAICGVASGYSRIYNCGILPSDNKFESETSRISGTTYVGGLVGWLKDDSRVVNCFSFATIEGGTTVGGIVGRNDFASTAKVTDGKYTELRTMVMNCMFYGDITGGTNRYPVYGGAKIVNNTATGINNYDYFRAEAEVGTLKAYNCSWPATEENLTRFEYYRSVLNSNRELAGWWVASDFTPSTLTVAEVQAISKDASLMAKWVLDPAVAPYPILKRPGKYASVINPDPERRYDPETGEWVVRASSTNTIESNNEPDTEGQTLGTLTVSINAGDNYGGSTSRAINITAMDIANQDYCYGKIQLPYYNEVFGNPDGDTWAEKYAGNYTDKVVTGWKVTAVTGGTEGTFTKDPITGYNFADREHYAKDLHSVSGRVFAQGGYFYVPYGVTAITIEAYWGTAYYLGNAPTTGSISTSAYDKIIKRNNNPPCTEYSFAPAGNRPATFGNGKSISCDKLEDLTKNISAGSTVYDCAVVLTGNYQHSSNTQTIGDRNKPFTLMSVDLDFDNEPDYCIEWQTGWTTTLYRIAPVRFDFLPIVELGLAIKEDKSTNLFKIGKVNPYGHFEVTETAYMYLEQYEYEQSNRDNGPIILNNGRYQQIYKGKSVNDTQHIDYWLLGGHVYIPQFTPGAHPSNDSKNATRHCAINVLGGEYSSFYLTGNYNSGAVDYTASPDAHCYIDGGKLDFVASVAKENIRGDVYWTLRHARVGEFYGGGTSSAKRVYGNITIQADRCRINKFCGGPQFGDMFNGKEVSTVATGTTFGEYYGAGNGGSSYSQYDQTDIAGSAGYSWESNGKMSGYNPGKYHGSDGYYAKYEMESVNSSSGSDAAFTNRTYLYAAQFATTDTGPVYSTLEDCEVLGNFYGGGFLGGVKGSATSVLKGATHVHGNVYGAGYSASVPTVGIYSKTYTPPVRNDSTSVITPPVYSDPTYYMWTNETNFGNTTLSTDNPTIINPNGDGINYIYTTVPLQNLGTVSGNVILTIGDGCIIGDDVADDDGGDVYGGGDESSVSGSTTVNLTGGTIYGDVYGGGRGNPTAAPTVGDVFVNLNPTETDNGDDTKSYLDECIVMGNIFGCNNFNGTPLGNVTVHVYKTWGTEWTEKGDLESIDDSKHKYHLKAVYGGGNLAAYTPLGPNGDGTEADNKNTTKFAQVIIDGCDLTSIRQVYGGGNAASTPATRVIINGAREIEEVFGGGNGKDDISRDGGTTYIANPGANVGYYDYIDYEDSEDPDKGAATKELREANYAYGTGAADVKIYGGRIHRVFGGSNTKGNVRVVAVTMLDSKSDCEFQVDEAYGGGKSAPMDGAAQLIMSCIPGLKAAYGGAEEADIHNDVILNITNGSFDRVFGGNNVRGTIDGTITVNVEETGCRPIIIGQLYGGGNQAPYEAPFVEGSTTERRPGPTLNVRSFTSIGEVYGGGYGATAVVTGDTHVNINVSEGRYYDQDDKGNDNVLEETIREISYTEFRRTTDGDFVLDNDSNRVEDKKTIAVIMPSHAKGAIGAIYNVYGGGNAANVIGNTFVNIGTATDDQQLFATPTDATETERTKAVIGADIRGNVYGGGNAADVTGNTNVKIGR